MKKAFLLITLLNSLLLSLLLPVELRAKLSRPLAAAIDRMMMHMPDEGPGQAILSGVLQTLEQNQLLLTLYQERLATEVDSPADEEESEFHSVQQY